MVLLFCKVVSLYWSLTPPLLRFLHHLCDVSVSCQINYSSLLTSETNTHTQSRTHSVPMLLLTPPPPPPPLPPQAPFVGCCVGIALLSSSPRGSTSPNVDLQRKTSPNRCCSTKGLLVAALRADLPWGAWMLPWDPCRSRVPRAGGRKQTARPGSANVLLGARKALRDGCERR